MSRILLVVSVVVWAGISAVAKGQDSYVDAEEYGPANMEQRIAALESELVALRRSVGVTTAADSLGGCGHAGFPCDGVCGCDCTDCCDNCGWLGGVEFLFLKPHRGFGTTGAFGENVDPDYDLGTRTTLGWMGSSGFGFRARYFDYDHAFSSPRPTVPGSNLYDLNTFHIDLELTDTFALGNWDATVSGGFRYFELVENRLTLNPAGALIAQAEQDFVGYGLVVGGELRRPITEQFAFYGGARAGLVYGDQDRRVIGTSFRLENEVVQMLEIALGGEYRHNLAAGYLFIRGGVEAQDYDNVVGEHFFDGGDGIGLVGFTGAIGIVR